jgi:hypothetical protein
LVTRLKRQTDAHSIGRVPAAELWPQLFPLAARFAAR